VEGASVDPITQTTLRSKVNHSILTLFVIDNHRTSTQMAPPPPASEYLASEFDSGSLTVSYHALCV